MKLCDLHTHSVYSDGTYTPEEIIDAAVGLGLSAVALTDHNCVDGLPDFLKAAEGKDIEAVPGAEFSVKYNTEELHLVALYIREEYFPEISEMMREARRLKEESNVALARALNEAGYEIDYEEIKAASPEGNINRAHFAEELTRLGYTETIDHAFATLLSPETGFYKEPERMDFFDAIRYVRSIGAVPVLAHPFLKLSTEQLSELLPMAKEAGLCGIECYYSTHDAVETETALRLAAQFGLDCSGGSDFHGKRKPDILLGKGKGSLQVPYEWAQALRKAAE